jgi:hypothetical protein
MLLAKKGEGKEMHSKELLSSGPDFTDDAVMFSFVAETLKRNSQDIVSEAVLSSLSIHSRRDFLNSLLVSLSLELLAEPLVSDNDKIDVLVPFRVYSSTWDAIKAILPKWVRRILRLKVMTRVITKVVKVKAKAHAVYPMFNQVLPKDQNRVEVSLMLKTDGAKNICHKKGSCEIDFSHDIKDDIYISAESSV